MHEYVILEKKWRKYQIKKYMIYVFIAGIIFIFGLYFYMTRQTNNSKKSIHQLKRKIVYENKIKPNLNFEKRLHIYNQPSKPKKRQKDPVKTQVDKKIVLNTQNVEANDLIKRYNNIPNKNLALMIAQIYLQKKDYKKALEWSVKANELDKSDARSWMIFAKAAYKLGKKRRALHALSLYLKNYDDPKIRSLYKKMVQGTFR